MPARSYSAGRFAFNLDGAFAGFAKSFSGGHIKGEVVQQAEGPSVFAKKHIAGIRHEAFTVEFGMGMGKALYSWIGASLEGSQAARSGEIVSADFDMKARRAMVFDGAYLTELTVPALDGASKDPAYLAAKIEPARLRHEKRNGETLDAKDAPEAKKWLPSNFRFELGDLPCDRISRVDSFTVRQAIARDRVGSFREPTKHPGKIEVPDLKVTFSAADAGPWEDWFRSFVIDGKCGDADELSGRITFLAPDRKEVLGTLELRQVGIFGLRPAPQAQSGDAVGLLEAQLYVEQMKLSLQAG